MRIVLDTSVLISALLTPNSRSDKVVQFCLLNEFAVFSEQTAAELLLKLSNKKFATIAPTKQTGRLVKAMVEYPKHEVSEHITACRDPKDDMFLELAVSANADFIVTGDKDLLALDPFRGVRILPPAEFARLYGIE